MDHQTFAALLDQFTAAGCANDGARFSGLFTEDGTYEDDFFGLFRGRAGIAGMLQRFHDTGENYRWDFGDLVTDGAIGYATFRFSFASKMPGYEAKPVLITGISCFRFEGDKIAGYRETFDTGIALAQLGFPADRIKRVLDKEAAAQNATSGAREHLDRFTGA
ncbi:MAG TPA: nuclear transport factor 2 family protein [Stellaceae bacterium]|jgi:limonene-1,2-epoxide hydrolase|nr:nuclear transport factor 2 family protein [Stellaceae bacterium]